MLDSGLIDPDPPPFPGITVGTGVILVGALVMFITTTGREATLAAGALLDRLEAHAEYQPRCFATAEAPDSLLTALGLIRLKTWRHFSRKTVDLKMLPTGEKIAL